MELSDLRVRIIPFDELLPAPAQGALLAETRSDRTDIVQFLKAFHDPVSEACVRLERAVLAGIGGGCQQPLGVLAVPQPDGSFHLRAALATDEGIRKAEAFIKPGDLMPAGFIPHLMGLGA
jgi:hydroxymethylbilane synthase